MNRWVIAIHHATFPRLFACEKDYRPPISTLSQRGCHNFLNINCFANLTLPDPTFRLTMKPSTTATFLAIVTATLGFGSLAQAQDLKVGIVDMNRVFSEYYKTKDAEKRVNEDKSTAKKELDERAARYRDLMQKWNDKQKMITDKLLNEDLRQQAQKAATSIASEIKSLERDMDEFRRRRETQLQEQVGRMRKGLLEDIKARVEEKAKLDNYDIIFDKSGKSPIGVNFLLFSKDGVDFTDEVLKVLNKNADPASSAPAPAKKDEEKKEEKKEDKGK